MVVGTCSILFAGADDTVKVDVFTKNLIVPILLMNMVSENKFLVIT